MSPFASVAAASTRAPRSSGASSWPACQTPRSGAWSTSTIAYLEGARLRLRRQRSAAVRRLQLTQELPRPGRFGEQGTDHHHLPEEPSTRRWRSARRPAAQGPLSIAPMGSTSSTAARRARLAERSSGRPTSRGLPPRRVLRGGGHRRSPLHRGELVRATPRQAAAWAASTGRLGRALRREQPAASSHHGTALIPLTPRARARRRELCAAQAQDAERDAHAASSPPHR